MRSLAIVWVSLALSCEPPSGPDAGTDAGPLPSVRISSSVAFWPAFCTGADCVADPLSVSAGWEDGWMITCHTRPWGDGEEIAIWAVDRTCLDADGCGGVVREISITGLTRTGNNLGSRDGTSIRLNTGETSATGYAGTGPADRCLFSGFLEGSTVTVDVLCDYGVGDVSGGENLTIAGLESPTMPGTLVVTDCDL